MSTIPPQPDDAMDWIDAHLDVWEADPAAVGLSELEVTELRTLLTSAQTSKGVTVARREASKAATADFDDKIQLMRAYASIQLTRIRTYARASANPQAIYTLAQIPAPAPRSETPPPAMPTDFRTQLLPSGALRFTFKCANPPRVQGVTYKVERQDAAQSPFVFVLNAKEKSFEDDGFPNTSPQITYRVTAQTSTKDSVATYFTVRYGAGNQQGGAQARIISQGPAVDSQAS